MLSRAWKYACLWGGGPWWQHSSRCRRPAMRRSVSALWARRIPHYQKKWAADRVGLSEGRIPTRPQQTLSARRNVSTLGRSRGSGGCRCEFQAYETRLAAGGSCLSESAADRRRQLPEGLIYGGHLLPSHMPAVIEHGLEYRARGLGQPPPKLRHTSPLCRCRAGCAPGCHPGAEAGRGALRLKGTGSATGPVRMGEASWGQGPDGCHRAAPAVVLAGAVLIRMAAWLPCQRVATRPPAARGPWAMGRGSAMARRWGLLSAGVAGRAQRMEGGRRRSAWVCQAVIAHLWHCDHSIR